MVTLLWLCCVTLDNSLPLSGPWFFHLLCKLFKSASLSFPTLCQRCASLPLEAPPLHTQRKARNSRSSREDSGSATSQGAPPEAPAEPEPELVSRWGLEMELSGKVVNLEGRRGSLQHSCGQEGQ